MDRPHSAYDEAHIEVRQRWSRKTDSRDYVIRAIAGDRITLSPMVGTLSTRDFTVTKAELLRRYYAY